MKKRDFQTNSCLCENRLLQIADGNGTPKASNVVLTVLIAVAMISVLSSQAVQFSFVDMLYFYAALSLSIQEHIGINVYNKQIKNLNILHLVNCITLKYVMMNSEQGFNTCKTSLYIIVRNSVDHIFTIYSMYSLARQCFGLGFIMCNVQYCFLSQLLIQYIHIY